MLIDGILVISVILIFIALYVISVKSAKTSYTDYCRTKRMASQKTSLWEVTNRAFPITGLAPCVIMLLVFVVAPLVFSISVAFTNFSGPSHAVANDVDWVGANNFKELLLGGSTWSKGFARIAIWTLVWAFFSTFTCYFGGLLVAVQLKEIGVKIAGVFRFIFILPYAVPSVITMLVWKNMLNGTFGIVNRTLKSLGILGADSIIPWLGNSTLAKVMCIVINLWAGFGYFMMLTMGTMTAIGNDLFEAAKIDGCSFFATFARIIFPMMQPIIATISLLAFRQGWNEYILPLVFTMTNDKMRPLTVGVNMLKNSGDGAASWEIMFAGATIAVIPMILVYLSFSKYFLGGSTAGAVKG